MTDKNSNNVRNLEENQPNIVKVFKKQNNEISKKLFKEIISYQRLYLNGLCISMLNTVYSVFGSLLICCSEKVKSIITD